MKFLLFFLLFSFSAFAQITPIPTPRFNTRIILPPVQVKPEYIGASLTNRGQHYIATRIHLARYFNDEGTTFLEFNSLEGKTKRSFRVLAHEIKKHEDKFNPLVLKDLINNFYQERIEINNSPDIDALIQLIMFEISKDASNDLKEMLEKMQEINRKKQAIREERRKQNERLNTCLAENARCSKREIRKLMDAIEQLQNDLDSMSEMGEMESLRLQMAMDRMSKMMSTLSNILKKISDTAQSIVQNIK